MGILKRIHDYHITFTTEVEGIDYCWVTVVNCASIEEAIEAATNQAKYCLAGNPYITTVVRES